MKAVEIMTFNATYRHDSSSSYFTGAISGRAGAEGIHIASRALGTETLAEIADSGMLCSIASEGCSASHREVAALTVVCEAFVNFAPQALAYMFRLNGSEAPMSVSANARVGVHRGEAILQNLTLITSMEGGTLSIFEGRLELGKPPVFADRSSESPSPLVKRMGWDQFFNCFTVRRYTAREALDCFAPLFLPKRQRPGPARAYTMLHQSDGVGVI